MGRRLVQSRYTRMRAPAPSDLQSVAVVDARKSQSLKVAVLKTTTVATMRKMESTETGLE